MFLLSKHEMQIDAHNLHMKLKVYPVLTNPDVLNPVYCLN